MKSLNVEFDDLFDPDVTGDGPVASGYAVGGVALRYAKLSYGTKRADVGYAIAGVDVANLWAAKGTAGYISISLTDIFDQLDTGSGGGTCTVGFTFSPNGLGGWWLDGLQSGAGNQYDVDFSLTGGDTGGTLVGVGAGWQQLNVERGVSLSVILPSGAPMDAGRYGSRVIRIRIRRRSDSVIMADKTISLSASVYRVY